jgi:hypothetical protein
MAEREFPDYTESIKLHFENLKQLTTLNAGSIVVIGTFLKDIFPRENGTLDVSAGIKLLIALSFISFGVSLVLASYGMFQYARRLWLFERHGQITRLPPFDTWTVARKVSGITCLQYRTDLLRGRSISEPLSIAYYGKRYRFCTSEIRSRVLSPADPLPRAPEALRDPQSGAGGSSGGRWGDLHHSHERISIQGRYKALPRRGGAKRHSPGPLGGTRPGLCRILDIDFREHLFPRTWVNITLIYVTPPRMQARYNNAAVTLSRTYLIVVATLVAAFVALYPYLGAMEMCDSGECPQIVQSASGGFSTACLIAAVLVVVPVLRAATAFGWRGATSELRPIQVFSSPDPPPPRPFS